MVTWLSPVGAEILYQELSTKAPRILEDGGWATSVSFVWWSRQEPIHLVRYPGAVVLVTHWYRGLRAEVHPIIFDWKWARSQMRDLLMDLARQLGVGRLEFQMKWTSRVLKKYMIAAGCQYEGTAKNFLWSHLDGQAHLIDVEIWAILLELGDNYGIG